MSMTVAAAAKGGGALPVVFVTTAASPNKSLDRSHGKRVSHQA